MKEIICRSGHRKFYPYKVYCFTSLTSSLALVLQTGFIEICESTRNAFATGKLADVNDGNIWKDF